MGACHSAGLKRHRLPLRHEQRVLQPSTRSRPRLQTQLRLREPAASESAVPLPLRAPGSSSRRRFPLVIKYSRLSLSGRYSRYKTAIHPAPRQRWEYIRFCVERAGALCFNIWPTRNVGPIEKSQISHLRAQSPSAQSAASTCRAAVFRAAQKRRDCG